MATYPYAVQGIETLDKPLIAQADPNAQKPKKPLPTWDNANQAVPLVAQPAPGVQPPAQQQQTQVQQQPQQNLNQQVLQTAQQKSIQGFQSPTMGLVAQQTNNLLKDPSMGKNYGQEKNLALEQQNRNMNQQLETMRQQTAPTAYAGQNLRDLTNVAMQAVQQRADTSRQIDTEQSAEKLQNLISALGQGRETVNQQQGIFTQDINNLINTRNAAEGERAQTQGFQENLALSKLGFDQATQMAAQQHGYNLETLNAQYGQEMAKLIANQDWTAGQAALDREAAILAQSTDIKAKQALQDKQNAFELEKAIATQDWQAGQNALDREAAKLAQSTDIAAKQALMDKQNEFDMKKLNATQDWQSAQNKIAQDFQLALQKNDINATATNLQKQLDLDKWKQENGQKFTAEQNAINNALQLQLKTMDIDSAKNLMELKNKLDMGMMVKEQDFSAVQNDLNRQLQLAVQKNDINAQLELTKLKAEIDKAAQQSQNEFMKSERMYTQAWQTSERLSEQDFNAVMKYRDYQNQLAMQRNDIEAQKYLADQNEKLQLKMQTNDMNQQEKMAYLTNSLNEARANNDVNRQKQILEFQHGQEMETIRQQQGFDAAQQYNQQQFQLAMQNNDFTQAQTMLKLQQTFQADQAAKDRALDEARIAIEQAGLDFTKMQQTYTLLADQDPTAAFNYLQKQVQPLGVTLKATDAATKAKQAIEADFEAQKYQWALTHPNLWDKTTNDLTAEGQKQFFQQYNEAINGAEAKASYDNLIKGIADSANLRGGADHSSEKYADYIMAYSKAQPWQPQMSYDSGGFFGVDSRSIKNVPAKNSLFTYNGGLYQVISDKSMRKSGENTETFQVIDVNSGEVRTISVSGKSNANLSIQGF